MKEELSGAIALVRVILKLNKKLKIEMSQALAFIGQLSNKYIEIKHKK